MYSTSCFLQHPLPIDSSPPSLSKSVFIEDPHNPPLYLLKAPPIFPINIQNITKHDYVTKPVSLRETLPTNTSRPAHHAFQALLKASEQVLHSSSAGLYASTVFRKSLPSNPPTAKIRLPSTATPALLRAEFILPSILHSLRAGS